MSDKENEQMIANLYESSLLFLEKHGSLQKFYWVLEENVKSGNPYLANDFKILVNVGEIFKLSDKLGEMVIMSPYECQSMFQDLLFGLSKAWIDAPSAKIGWEIFKSNFKTIEKPSHFTFRLETVVKDILNTYKPLESYYEISYQQSNDQCLPTIEDPFPEWDSQSFYSTEEAAFGECSKTETHLSQEFSPNFEIVNPSFLKELMIKSTQHSSTKIKISSKSQIHVRLCVEGLPYLPPFKITGMNDLSKIRGPQTAIVSGQVMAFSLPKRYTIWAYHLCASNCFLSSTEINISTWSPIEYESKICKFCSSPLIEDPSARKEGEEMKALLIPDSEHSKDPNTRFSGIQRSLVLNIKDCERSLVTLGGRIEATVFVVPTKSNQHPTLHVSYIYPPIKLRTPSHIPKVLRQLRADRSSSPWSLVLTLAYMFCSDITPSGTFIKLKMALLLSLASCSSDESVLAMLAVGKCELIHKRLLKRASQLAPCFISHSPLDEFEGKAFKNSEGDTWVEAGSLLRAKGGVCIVEDLAAIKKETKSAVCRVLENEAVRLQIPTELKGSFHATAYPLRTCIWSTYNPCGTKKRTVEEDVLFLHAPVGNLTKSVTDVFGLVTFSDSSTMEQDTEVQEYICEDTLLRQIDDKNRASTLLPMKELTQYLQVVRSMTVSFTKESEALLQGYYVTIRRLRGPTMPLTAINTLTKVAKCHAKLSLRATVDVGDAAAAILLCEEALTARTGLSSLGVQSHPHLSRRQDLHNILGRKNDENMKKFIDHINCFISQNTNDIELK